jgi:hypothetical protein
VGLCDRARLRRLTSVGALSVLSRFMGARVLCCRVQSFRAAPGSPAAEHRAELAQRGGRLGEQQNPGPMMLPSNRNKCKELTSPDIDGAGLSRPLAGVPALPELGITAAVARPAAGPGRTACCPRWP